MDKERLESFKKEVLNICLKYGLDTTIKIDKEEK